MHACHRRLFLVVVLLMLPSAARGEDWPMYGRDRNRNAVSPEKGPPLWWQVKDNHGPNLQSSKNIKWQAKLGSLTNCDPVIAHGFVWVGASVQDDKTRVRSGNLMCFREKDGKLLYQHRSLGLPAQEDGPAYAGHTSSPLFEGNRAWFTTIRFETVCLDIGPLQRGDGQPKELWKVDMVKELGVFPSDVPMGYGKTCSIAASYKDRIFVCTGNGADDEGKTPQPKAPSVVCFDKTSGKILWTDNSPGKNILEGQWASPLVMEIHGGGQVIVPQGDGWVRSFDAMNGELIWKFDASPRSIGDPHKRNQLLATPVYHGGYIYIGTGAQFSYLPRRFVVRPAVHAAATNCLGTNRSLLPP
jgi:outer membrane protein assembly factor BamB